MHPDESSLRALYDSELPLDLARSIEQHLANCAACATRYQRMTDRAEMVQARLTPADLAARQTPLAATSAYARLSKNISTRSNQKEPVFSMNNRKPLWAALTVLAVVLLAFSQPTVRAWASDFLSLFRVQNITVLEIDPLAFERMEGDMATSQDTLENLFRDNLTYTGGDDLQPVSSLEEASAQVAFTPRIPTGMADVQYAVQPGMNAELTIDQPEMQAVLDALETGAQIPAEVDGEIIYFSAESGVVAADGCPVKPADDSTEDCVRLYQLPAPSVTAPAGLDVQKLGEGVLKALNLSDNEIRAFSSSVDWTSTLIIPIPRGENVQYSDVTVDGVQGVLLSNTEGRSGFMLMWVKDGIFYVLDGPGREAQALAIAETMP